MTTDTLRMPVPISVRHYVPGGRERGGGIGRLIGYIADAQPEAGRHLVQDTRGPRWSTLPSSLRLGLSMLVLLRDRLFYPARLHHFHVAGRGSTARKLVLTTVARTLGVRHVLHLHDYDYATDFQSRPGWQQAAVRRMFRGADRVIVLGKRDHGTMRDLLGVDPDRIEILYNSVPDPEPQPRRKAPGAPVRILFLGQLGPRKGVPELMDAFAHELMSGRRWTAILAGDGPVAEYRARARELGLEEKVTLSGWLTSGEAAALCAEADILTLPSHGEGFAMSVLEGLAHGLAVVTTRVGAHDELLEGGESCVFVPVGDPAALAQALANLVDSPEARERLGRAGRELFLSRLNIRTYVERLEALHLGLRQAPEVARGAA